MKRFKRYKNN